jgi:hypothetical protein
MTPRKQTTPKPKAFSRFKLPARHSPGVAKKSGQTPGHSPVYKGTLTPAKQTSFLNLLNRSTPSPIPTLSNLDSSQNANSIDRTGAIIISTPAKKQKKSKSVIRA